jgi:hypothetical protein
VKVILSKLLLSRQLSSVDEILHRSKTAIILQGKINLRTKTFSSLKSENVVIKIFVNGSFEELRFKGPPDFRWDKVNVSEFIMYPENILIMSMIGENEPAMTLQQVLTSRKYQKISSVSREVVRLWADTSYTKFDPTNILWHDGKWWLVGYTSTWEEINREEQGKLEGIKESLKKIVAMYGHYNVTKEQAEYEILNYHPYFYDPRLFYLEDVFLREDFQEIFFS